MSVKFTPKLKKILAYLIVSVALGAGGVSLSPELRTVLSEQLVELFDDITQE